jgi:hypothetical protein
MSLVVHFITDRDAAVCAELERRVAAALPGAAVRVTRVAPHDTLAAGHRVAEAASAAAGTDVVIAHDIAAGPGEPGPWPAGVGERVFIGHTAAGPLIIGTNVGWTWSRVVADLDGLYMLDVPVPEDVHRPERLGTAIAHARRRHPHAIAGAVPRAQVPPLPQPVAVRLPGISVRATKP